MEVMNVVEQEKTPLYKELLLLIPMLKALEDHRASLDGPLPPLLLEVEHHREGGALTLELSNAPVRNDGRMQPSLTLNLYNEAGGRSTLTYGHAFALTWSYISKDLPMSSIEYKAMYSAFWVSWAAQLFEYEQYVKELDLHD